MTSLKHVDMVVGNKYRIVCGWGPTVAFFEGSTYVGERTMYSWRERTGFRFISWDLEDTELVQ